MTHLRAEALLDQPDGAQSCQHFLRLRGQRPPAFRLGQGASQYGTVLTDLEVGEMKPEGLHLPDQRLHVAIGLPRGSR